VVSETLLLSAELVVDALGVRAVLLLLLLLQLLESTLDSLLLIISDLGQRALLLLLSASELRQSPVHLTRNRATGRDTLCESLLRVRELSETRPIALDINASRAAVLRAWRAGGGSETSDRARRLTSAERGSALAGRWCADSACTRATTPRAKRRLTARRLTDHTSLTLDNRDADWNWHRYTNWNGNAMLLHDGLSLLNLQKLRLVVSELLQEEVSGLLVLCLREVRMLLEPSQLLEHLETPRVVLWLLRRARRRLTGLQVTWSGFINLELGKAGSVASIARASNARKLESFRVDGNSTAAEAAR